MTAPKSPKHFLDTSVARPLVVGRGDYRDYLNSVVSDRRYISPYVYMEFRRGFIVKLIQAFTTISMPHFRTADDAFSYLNNRQDDREIRAFCELIRVIFTNHQVDLTDPNQKELALHHLADYIQAI